MARSFRNELAPDSVRSLLEYDGSTGMFRWRKPRRTMARGWFAGHMHRSGYLVIQVNGRQYSAHRLAFAVMTGAWPAEEIDHKDRSRANNKWENLREATSAQNAANRSGWATKANGLPKGVFQAPKKQGRFVAKIGVGGRLKHLGTFDTIEEAAESYRRAVASLGGEFAHHGH